MLVVHVQLQDANCKGDSVTFSKQKIILITTMKQRVLIVLVYIFYFTDVFAQSQNQFLMEIIVSDTLGNTISGVGIYGEDNYIKGVTDKTESPLFLQTMMTSFICRISDLRECK